MVVQAAKGPIGIVLAGGHSSRMGQGKPGLALAGQALIEYPLKALAAAGLAVSVIAKSHTSLPDLGVPTLVEPDMPVHPLTGIVAALRHAAGSPILVVACDMPFVTADLATWLAGFGEDLVIPQVDGCFQPLLALYRPTILESLELALQTERSLHTTLSELDPRLVTAQELTQFGDPTRLLFDVDTPAELAQAEQWLAAS